jgi:glycerol-3-phosphate dehydrogenase
VSVVGGKITGYRAIAEEVGRLVAQRLGRAHVPASTDERPLPGGRLFDLDQFTTQIIAPSASELGLDQRQATHLGHVYGSLAPEVLRLAREEPRLAERVCPHHPSIGAEVARAFRSEWAVSLADVLLRRTSIGLGACQALDCLDEVSKHVGRIAEWTTEECARQVDAYRREVEPMRRFSAQPATAAR